MDTAREIEALIVSMADERQAEMLRRFFKTGKGEYGEGDKFLGVRNPQVRSVVKEAWTKTTLDEAATLAQSQWHEARLCGLLIMVAMYEKAAKGKIPDEVRMKAVFERYLSLHPFINNWDLVDLSAYKIAGAFTLSHPGITTLDEWIKPGHTLWQRRISMVSTWIHIRHHQFRKAFARAEALLDSRHDLLHKATGWMLREIYKHDGRDEVEDFLEAHVSQMPSIMLSYTTELMPPQEREHWRREKHAIC